MSSIKRVGIKRVGALSALAFVFAGGVATAAGASEYGTPTGSAEVVVAVPSSGIPTGVVSGFGFNDGTRVTVSSTFRIRADIRSISGAVASAASTLTCGETTTVDADGDGKANVTVVPPAGQVGTCSVTMAGLASDGSVAVLAAEVDLTGSAPAAEGTGLPRTGSDSAALTRYALMTIGVGALMTVSARRARRLRALHA